jgi:hypothetical protein
VKYVGMFFSGLILGVLFGIVDIRAGAAAFGFLILLALCTALDEITAYLKRLSKHAEWTERVQAARFRKEFPHLPWTLEDMHKAEEAADKAAREAHEARIDQQIAAATAARDAKKANRDVPTFRGAELVPDVPAEFQAETAGVDFTAIEEVAHSQAARRRKVRP